MVVDAEEISLFDEHFAIILVYLSSFTIPMVLN